MLLFHTLKFSRPFSLSNVIVCADIVEKNSCYNKKTTFFSLKKNFVLKKNVGRGYKSSGVIFSSSPNLLNRTRMTFFFSQTDLTSHGHAQCRMQRLTFTRCINSQKRKNITKIPTISEKYYLVLLQIDSNYRNWLFILTDGQSIT